MPADLYDALIERNPAVKGSSRSDHAVAPSHRRLHHLAGSEGNDERNNRIKGKIDMGDDVANIKQDLVLFQLDGRLILRKRLMLGLR